MELCHEIEIIVATKPKTKTKKIIVTYDNSVAIKNKAYGKNILSRHYNLYHDRRREE